LMVRKPSEHSLNPQPQLRPPLPLYPKPQHRLHPLHLSGSSSEGGRVQYKIIECLVFQGACGFMDVRYV